MRTIVLALGLGIALAPGNAVAEKVVIGSVPLVTAARTGNLAEVRQQLLIGVNPNKSTLDGGTALMQAALNGRADIAVALLKSGARINARNKSGNTALIIAAEKGSALLVTLLAALEKNDLKKGVPSFVKIEIFDDVGDLDVSFACDPSTIKKSKLDVDFDISRLKGKGSAQINFVTDILTSCGVEADTLTKILDLCGGKNKVLSVSNNGKWKR